MALPPSPGTFESFRFGRCLAYMAPKNATPGSFGFFRYSHVPDYYAVVSSAGAALVGNIAGAGSLSGNLVIGGVVLSGGITYLGNVPGSLTAGGAMLSSAELGEGIFGGTLSVSVPTGTGPSQPELTFRFGRPSRTHTLQYVSTGTFEHWRYGRPSNTKTSPMPTAPPPTPARPVYWRFGRPPKVMAGPNVITGQFEFFRFARTERVYAQGEQIVVVVGVSTALQGTIFGTGEITGSLTVGAPDLAAVIDGTGEITGLLTGGGYDLAGVIDGTGEVTGTLTTGSIIGRTWGMPFRFGLVQNFTAPRADNTGNFRYFRYGRITNYWSTSPPLVFTSSSVGRMQGLARLSGVAHTQRTGTGTMSGTVMGLDSASVIPVETTVEATCTILFSGQGVSEAIFPSNQAEYEITTNPSQTPEYRSRS